MSQAAVSENRNKRENVFSSIKQLFRLLRVTATVSWSSVSIHSWQLPQPNDWGDCQEEWYKLLKYYNQGFESRLEHWYVFAFFLCCASGEISMDHFSKKIITIYEGRSEMIGTTGYTMTPGN
jgi:hypothetical protein